MLAEALPASLRVDPECVRLKEVAPRTILNLADWHCNRMLDLDLISLKPTGVVSKALVLAMPPLEDNAANESEDEEDGKEADGGEKPGFV